MSSIPNRQPSPQLLSNYFNESNSSIFDQLSPVPVTSQPSILVQEPSPAAVFNPSESIEPCGTLPDPTVASIPQLNLDDNPLLDIIPVASLVTKPGFVIECPAIKHKVIGDVSNTLSTDHMSFSTPAKHVTIQDVNTSIPLTPAPILHDGLNNSLHFAQSPLANSNNIQTPLPNILKENYVTNLKTPILLNPSLEQNTSCLEGSFLVPPRTPSQQSAMMMSMTDSMVIPEVSPNTSMNVETVIVKFKQASLEDKVISSPPSMQSVIPQPIVNQNNDLLAITPPQQSNLGTIVPTDFVTSTPSSEIGSRITSSESKLFKYFANPACPSPFETLIPKAIDNGNESTTMNPVYMSPSDSFHLINSLPSPDSFLTPSTEQDVFTASLLSSDADRRHEAWIPSEHTRQALLKMLAGPQGVYFPEKELLTMPGIAVKEDFGDPVKNMVRSFLGEEFASKRKVLTSSLVTQDDRGLRQLISQGCYHSAVNLTTNLLTVSGQGEGKAGHPSKHTAHSLQLWFVRTALLVKLRRFSLAEVECQYFGDLDGPDLYFEFYPQLYPGRKGSMVPFGFRLLLAELPQYLGKHTQALDRLNVILRICDKISENLKSGLSEDGSGLELTSKMREDSLKLWKNRRLRVMYAITNCAVSLKDFRLAGGLLERLIQEDPNSAAGLYSALGRLCLQLGDVAAAQETFNHYHEHTPPPPHHDPVQGLLHSAYIAIAQNAFKDAVDILQQAHKINSNNGLVISNLGVCLMYTGRVQDAIKLVEGAVFSQPDRFLHEGIILNLATMYELESSHAHQKKLKLLELISQHKGDSFNVAALKLQPQ